MPKALAQRVGTILYIKMKMNKLTVQEMAAHEGGFAQWLRCAIAIAATGLGVAASIGSVVGVAAAVVGGALAISDEC